LQDDDRPDDAAYWPQFAAGAGMVAMVHVLMLGAVWGVVAIASVVGASEDLVATVTVGASFWTIGLGVGQLAFVIPMVGLLMGIGRRAMAMGVLTAAAVVFLLNAAIATCLTSAIAGGTALCFGILLSGPGLAH
jgi:hypothetical protein